MQGPFYKVGLKVVIGAMDAKSGACGSVINLLNNPKFNHQVEVVTGVLSKECSRLMKDFQLIKRKINLAKILKIFILNI